MTWYRIEGNMPQHEKYAPLSDAAFRLAITAGAWCASMMTDGRLPKKMIAGLTRAPAGKKLDESVKELIDARIWDRIEGDDAALFVHDFLDWNMSRAQWQAKKDAGSAGGKAKAAAKQKQQPKQKTSKRLAPASDSLEQNTSTSSSVPLADSDLRSPISDPEERNQKEDLPRSPNGEPTATTGYPELVKSYFDAFEARRLSKPLFGSREGKAVKALLSASGGDVARARCIIESAYRDQFWGDKVTILEIAKDPSKFIGNGNGTANHKTYTPPQPNDERNRYVPPRIIR